MRRSPTYVRELIHSQQLHASKEGAGYLIELVDIDTRLQKQKKPQPSYRKGTHPKTAERWAKQRALPPEQRAKQHGGRNERQGPATETVRDLSGL